MPVKLLFTVVGFNGLVLVFLAGVVVAYFRPAQFALTTSLFLGWLTAFVNLNSSEPQFPVLLLLSFGFFIGFVVHHNVWKYALVLGMFVPIPIVQRGRHFQATGLMNTYFALVRNFAEQQGIRSL